MTKTTTEKEKSTGIKITAIKFCLVYTKRTIVLLFSAVRSVAAYEIGTTARRFLFVLFYQPKERRLACTSFLRPLQHLLSYCASEKPRRSRNKTATRNLRSENKKKNIHKSFMQTNTAMKVCICSNSSKETEAHYLELMFILFCHR